MRRVFLALAIFGAVPNAWGQSSGSSDRAIIVETWDAQPSQQDFVSHYPAAAHALGTVWMDCLVLATRRLNCTLLNEYPSGEGLGAAALSLAPLYRAPATVGGETTIGGRVLVSVALNPPAGRNPPLVGPIPVSIDPPPPGPTALIEHPTWTAQPSAAQLAAAYPVAAIGTHESTTVTVTCFAGLYGLLHCYSASAPLEVSGLGFDTAALSLMRFYRIAESGAEGGRTAGHLVMVRITFDPPS